MAKDWTGWGEGPDFRRRSLTAQIAEAERELKMRREVYPRLVAQRKMRQGEMDEKIMLLRNVVVTLRMIEAHRDKLNLLVAQESGDDGVPRTAH
jgi:hypothetical protein